MFLGLSITVSITVNHGVNHSTLGLFILLVMKIFYFYNVQGTLKRCSQNSNKKPSSLKQQISNDFRMQSGCSMSIQIVCDDFQLTVREETLQTIQSSSKSSKSWCFYIPVIVQILTHFTHFNSAISFGQAEYQVIISKSEAF